MTMPKRLPSEEVANTAQLKKYVEGGLLQDSILDDESLLNEVANNSCKKIDDQNSIVSEALTCEEDASPIMKSKKRIMNSNTKQHLQEVIDEVLPRAIEFAKKKERKERKASNNKKDRSSSR